VFYIVFKINLYNRQAARNCAGKDTHPPRLQIEPNQHTPCIRNTISFQSLLFVGAFYYIGMKTKGKLKTGLKVYEELALKKFVCY